MIMIIIINLFQSIRLNYNDHYCSISQRKGRLRQLVFGTTFDQKLSSYFVCSKLSSVTGIAFDYDEIPVYKTDLFIFLLNYEI